LASRSGASLSSHVVPDVASPRPLLQRRSPDLVAIDEAQFFGPDLVEVIDELAARGIAAIVAGLCVTFDGRPFEPLPSLMATAEVVTRLTAICGVCGGDAAFHQRVSTEPVGDALASAARHVGGIETYQARCRHHLDGQP